MTKKYDVFISYRRDNGFLMAQVIHDRLTARGLKVFLDLDELHSGEFGKKILSAIDCAPNFLLILPAKSLDRCINEDDWLRKEIVYAVRSKKNIIPIMLDGFEFPKEWQAEIPDEVRVLGGYQSVKSTKEYLSAMIDKIISYLVDVNLPGKEIEIKDTINFATSNLTVIDSLIKGSDVSSVFKKFGFGVETITYKWSDKILDDLVSGKIDMALYNKKSVLEYNSKKNTDISIVADVCSSMGGRNFYILASIYGKWKDMTYEQFKNSLDNTTVFCVAKNSDMYKNLLYLLDMTESELLAKGVRIVDYHAHQGLSVFDFMPDALVIGGQDIRFLARKSGEYIEIISYDDFPNDKKEFFYQNSINSLIVGQAGRQKLASVDVKELGYAFLENFYHNMLRPEINQRIIKELSRSLSNICDDEETKMYIITNILYETYRILRG